MMDKLKFMLILSLLRVPYTCLYTPTYVTQPHVCYTTDLIFDF